MKIAVVGAGYVGLVQAAGLAHLGHTVSLADASPERLDALHAGKLPVYEPGLSEMFGRAVSHGRIGFHGDNVEAVRGADVVFLTLPTPPGEGGRADVSAVMSVVREIGPHVGSAVIATKSTVPTGTAAKVRDLLREIGSSAGVVSNPEFLAEGNAVEDFMRAERIVIGGFDAADADKVAAVYSGLVAEIILMDPLSAELTKYGANAFLAARLTFANALSNLAEELGADVLPILEAIGLDRRIGPHFLRPGPGYGGSCFPKDISALLGIADDVGYDFKMLRAVIETDSQQRERIVARCLELLDGDATGKRVALWGLAFKAGTDDTRESPAVKVGMALAEAGAVVTAYDPEASVAGMAQAASALDAAVDADLLIVGTEWPVFMRVEPSALESVMRGNVVYDLRNLLDPMAMRRAGFRYLGVGRPG